MPFVIVSRLGSTLARALILSCSVCGCALPTGEDGGADEAELVGNNEPDFVATTAEEPPPPTPIEPCATPALSRAYEQGAKAAIRAVRDLWSEFGKCTRVEAFADRVVEKFDSWSERTKPDAGPRRQCRQAGVSDGTFSELERIQVRCESRCFLTGERVGAIKARLYCELMIENQGQVDIDAWMRKPVAVCGLNYQVGCDATFLSSTRSYANPSGACLPYTEVSYQPIWNHARLRVCEFPRGRLSTGAKAE
jgi:hypothetical protein